MIPRTAARSLGLGRLVYNAWWRPRAFVRRCVDEGPLTLFHTARGRREMEVAATALKASPARAGEPFATEVVFLTGARFWFQTAFCAWTFQRHSPRPIRMVFLDDGTLANEQASYLQRIVPGSRVVTRDEIERQLDESLPAARYPTLRRQRIVYPHLRKLTDVHAGLTGPRVVLDSDMLFWREPAELLAWLHCPGAPIHLVDCQDSYGYSFELLDELAGRPIPRRMNVGIVGLASESIDWDFLERMTRETLERGGKTYFQEQALTALLLANREHCALPESHYVCKPDPEEVANPRAALHHYVAESKNPYFQFAWRRAFEAQA